MSASQQALAGGGGGANGWSFVDAANTYNSGSGTTLNHSIGAVTTGQNIFVFIRYEASTTTLAVTDNAGNTYTGLTEQAGTGQVLGRWFYCPNATGHASLTLTATWGAARSFRWIGALRFNKAAASFDVQAGGTAASSTTVTSGSFTTAGSGLLLAGRGSYNQQNDPNSVTWNSSLINPIASDNLNFGAVGYRITTGALTTHTVTETGSSSTNRALCIAAFS